MSRPRRTDRGPGGSDVSVAVGWDEFTAPRTGGRQLTREVLCGDSAEVLKRLADDTCSLCLCDPPYGLSFMGSSWDAEVPGVAIWREVLRVLKPGASCFVCSGARQDTLLGNLLALKQAGFDIQHSALTWVFANGAMPKSTNLSKDVFANGAMPKSTNLSKDADKAAFNAWVKALIADGSLTLQAKCQLEAEHAAMSKRGETCPVCEVRLAALASGGDNLVTRADLRKAASAAVGGAYSEVPDTKHEGGVDYMCAGGANTRPWLEAQRNGPQSHGTRLLSALIARFGAAPGVRAKVGVKADPRYQSHSHCRVMDPKRQGADDGTTLGHYDGPGSPAASITAPSTPEAQALEGLAGGSVPLKPMSETVLWVTKPQDRKPIRENVLKHGTGGVAIDDCRIPFAGDEDINDLQRRNSYWNRKHADTRYSTNHSDNRTPYSASSGRYPSNLLITARALGDFSKYCDLDAWAEAHDLPPSWLDAAEEGILRVPKPSRAEKNAGCEGLEEKAVRPTGNQFGECTIFNGENGDDAWRKKNPSLPRTNFHSTVKPALLMEYLIALACPEGGLVLDPFCGSGSTGVAAARLNRPFIGIDLSEEYCEIARARIAHAEAEREDAPDAQPTLELEAADV